MRNQKLFEESLSLKTHVLTDRQIADLELLLVGGFAPLKGFVHEADYKSIIKNSRLANGKLWPIPIVLDTDQQYAIGQKITLIDTYNTPLAILEIESIYTPDKLKEVKAVYGTTDTSHFGVNYILNKTKNTYIGGKVTPLFDVEKYYSHTPKVVQQKLKKHKAVVAFQTRNPIHRAHFELIERSAKETNAHILIHPAVGETKDGDINPQIRIKIYEHIIKRFGKNKASLALLPLAMRMAGPKEALWHALIRKNYGATHFIVGRDHAGPGGNFYGPYDAQKFVKKYEREIGIRIVTSKELVYIENTDSFVPIDKVPKNANVKSISGSELRNKLKNGEDIPEWFSFKEVIDELTLAQKTKGTVIFFTGLSSSGKSTIAQSLIKVIQQKSNKPITYLDGDQIRHHLSYGLGFSKEDRDRNVKRVGFVASEIARHGGTVVITLIAPYQESRDYVKKLVSQHGTFVEVYVSTSLQECIKRDVKGVYAKAKNGHIKNVTGIHDPYEIPENPTIILDTAQGNPEELAKKVFDYINKQSSKV